MVDPDADARIVAFDPDRLAVEAARRDPRQFETLYRKYVGQVYNFAVYELHDHHAAEDLTEQVFLRARLELAPQEVSPPLSVSRVP